LWPASQPARAGPVKDGETRQEPAEVELLRMSAEADEAHHEEIRQDEADQPRQAGIGIRSGRRTDRPGRINPHLGGGDPAEQAESGGGRQRQRDDEQAEPDGPPVLRRVPCLHDGDPHDPGPSSTRDPGPRPIRPAPLTGITHRIGHSKQPSPGRPSARPSTTSFARRKDAEVAARRIRIRVIRPAPGPLRRPRPRRKARPIDPRLSPHGVDVRLAGRPFRLGNRPQPW
jgi:hypothetical protein